MGAERAGRSWPIDGERTAALRTRGSIDARPKRRRILTRLVRALPWLALSSCAGVGPATLGAGRGAYNDVIARTNAEEMLALIVRLRYSDPIGLITVGNVTANLRFSARAAGEAGIGSQSSYAGNLVPFSAGVAYEDNPTISYAPVDAEAFVRTWLRPLPLEIVAPAMQGAKNADRLLPMLVERMNGLRSQAETAPERAGFARAATLLQSLRDLGIAAWVDVSEQPGKPRYELVLDGYAPGHTAEVGELLQLLEIPAETRHGAAIRVPVSPGVRPDRSLGLSVETRSISMILTDAARLVEVPEEDVQAGFVVPNVTAPDAQMPGLRIRSSRKTPEHANVAVKHRDSWYYVDDTDLGAKSAFQVVQMLFVSQLSAAARGAQKSPVLTIPVR